MTKKKKISKPKIFFNASVVLSGLYSKRGGSALILNWVKQKKAIGIVSEIIIDEIFRHTSKLNLTKASVGKFLYHHFQIQKAPPESAVKKYYRAVIDYGDAHVLASAKQSKSDYLVSLDKKHLLSLQTKIKSFSIVSPGELIQKIQGS